MIDSLKLELWPQMGVLQGSSLTPVHTKGVVEQAVARLVTAISLGEFVPGQRLPTTSELAAALGMNQSSIREALQRLARAGYVEIRRGRNGGTFVMSSWGPDAATLVRGILVPNWDMFEHLFDLRRLAEPLIARTAAERNTDVDAAALVEANERYVAAEGDREASRAADQHLHATVAAATHNPYLVSLSLQIRARICLGFQAEPYSDELRAAAIADHSRLVVAILAGDGESAATIAGDHFALTENAIRELLQQVVHIPGVAESA